MRMLIEKKYQRGDVTLNYADDGGSSPPLLLTHGLTDRWQYFLPIIPSLSERWHVYALDFRGHGKSSRSPPYTYGSHIADIIAFLENVVREEVVLFSSSLGGMVSLMVAAMRPDLVKALVFVDANIKVEGIHEVMVNYHSYWSGWRKIAAHRRPFEEMLQQVQEMPVSIPGQLKKTYGEGLGIVSLMNKTNYLRHLDPEVLVDWELGGVDPEAFRRVTSGYDETLIKQIKCPVLLIQANVKKGAILRDDEVEYARRLIPRCYHVFIEEYDHNTGLYDWNPGRLLQAANVFLETLR